MSYFKLCADYHIRTAYSGASRDALRHVAARCKAKYPRGINLVPIEQSLLDDELLTPHSRCVDPGRIFLTYHRLRHEALNGLDESCDEKPMWIQLKQAYETYDPDHTLLFLCVQIGNPGGADMEFYAVDF